MLVLGRLPQERIIITTPEGRRITVTFCGTKGTGNNAHGRIGFEADPEVRIDREELHERIAAEPPISPTLTRRTR